MFFVLFFLQGYWTHSWLRTFVNSMLLEARDWVAAHGHQQLHTRGLCAKNYLKICQNIFATAANFRNYIQRFSFWLTIGMNNCSFRQCAKTIRKFAKNYFEPFHLDFRGVEVRGFFSFLLAIVYTALVENSLKKELTWQ